MITVTIGSSSRNWESLTNDWVMDQIQRRRADGYNACVRVEIQVPTINMVLSTPGCAGVGGYGRRPTSTEARIFDLWDKLRLNTPDFAPGNVVAFFGQLSRFLP